VRSFLICIHPQISLSRSSDENKVGGACALVGDERKVHKVLVGKPEEKRSLGRPRSRWKDGTRMDLGGDRLGM
jgi:hypothetical protein